ncbi:MAG: MFS transporter [Magnetospirillum sp.]|nr:MFS transporter [Magnetospirillum sp.]
MSTPRHGAAAVLAIRPFRLFLAARFVTATAFQMVGVAVGWQIYALTGDPLHLGYVGLTQFVPILLLALPAGHAADRFDRRHLLVACLGVEALAVAALLILSLSPTPPLGTLYAILAVMGAGRAFLAPANQSLVPLLVPPPLFPRAVAWGSISYQVAVIAGPAMGGLLYAFGPGAVYGVSLTLMVGAAVAVVVLGTPLIAQAAVETGLEGVLAGLGYIWRRKDILGAVSLDLFAVLLGGATALLPIFARDILDTGPLGLGLLRSAPALGAAAMAITLAHRPLQGGTGTKLFASVAVFGLATIVFGLSTDIRLSMAALAVLGAADMISVVVRQTLVQIRTPDSMRGRVSAVNWVFIGASNELGEFESGLTASWFGAMPAVVIGGLGTLAVAGLWAWRFPELRKIDRLG